MNKKRWLPVLGFLLIAGCRMAAAEMVARGDTAKGTVTPAAIDAHTAAVETGRDSVPRFGFTAYINPGMQIATDRRIKKLLKETGTVGVGAELSYMTLPSDSDNYASDFGFPTLSLGLRYTFNNSVRMHRDPDPIWGTAQEVDYDSRLGNTLSLYVSFRRPILRIRHWEVDYTLGAGLAWSNRAYNPNDDIDNELIGSHINCYFNAGAHITYHFVPEWGIKMGVDFVHHSNGALDRPNKGSNAVGPTIGITYTPYYEAVRTAPRYAQRHVPFDQYLYLNFTVGAGMKALHEEYSWTQYKADPTDADYRTEHFHHYAAYSVQMDFMWRYARRWASGIGFDVFYGTYHQRLAELDAYRGKERTHSPWSLGVAGKHTVFYGQWSLPMEVGWYCFRRMGYNAKISDKPYYERIGLHYHFAALSNISIGINVSAHAFKANFTEIAASVPVRL